MPGNNDPSALSELEREFEYEFELDDDPPGIGESEAEYEFLFEGDESAAEYEVDDDREYEYAERFYELSQREFESETEAESAVNELLTDMEPEYFFGGIGKAFRELKKKGRQFSKSRIGGLIKKGVAAAGGQIPAFQALKGMTALARGDMRGLLAQLAKSGLGAALPGAGPFLPAAMKAMGFEAGAPPEENREAWDNFVSLSREAYQNLANNLTERADDPLEASRLANKSFQEALHSAPHAHGQRPRSSSSEGGRRIVHVRPGEEIIIRVRRD